MKKNIHWFLASAMLFAFGTSRAQVISTVAGINVGGYSGDGGQATMAELSGPGSLGMDDSGNIYIADVLNYCIRKVNMGSGIITTVAGIGKISGFSGDGGPATAAELGSPWGLSVDQHNNLFISDNSHDCIRKVNTGGIINTIAGIPNFGGYSGDGGPATAAELRCPTGVNVDKFGNVYISDQCNNVIRMVNTGGIISTIAGNGTSGYSGDGGPATAAELNQVVGVNADENGNIYISDGGNAVVRVVNSAGIINTLAGNGTSGYSGDGGPATAAEISSTSGFETDIAYDTAGNLNLFIPDGYNNRIRDVNMYSNIINTFAGNGVSGYSGDGGPATAAELSSPASNLVSNGAIFIADDGNNVVREVKGLPLLAINTPHPANVSVYPNPATGQIYINMLSLSSDVNLELYDELGNQVLNETVKGDQLLDLPVSNVKSGIYFLKLLPVTGMPIVKKVVIVN